MRRSQSEKMIGAMVTLRDLGFTVSFEDGKGHMVDLEGKHVRIAERFNARRAIRELKQAIKIVEAETQA